MTQPGKTCANCQHVNEISATHCSNCGKSLQDTIGVISDEDRQRLRNAHKETVETMLPKEPVKAPSDETTDPDASVTVSDKQDKTENEDEPKGEGDGESEDETNTADEADAPRVIRTEHVISEEVREGEIRYGTVKLQGSVVLKDVASGVEFVIPPTVLDKAVIGRSDPSNKTKLSVDLGYVGGQKQGVSRVHATIALRNNVLSMIDHNSLNGTFLNGMRLVPEQWRVVRNGDIVEFGKTKLQIHFIKD